MEPSVANDHKSFLLRSLGNGAKQHVVELAPLRASLLPRFDGFQIGRNERIDVFSTCLGNDMRTPMRNHQAV